VRRGAGDDRAQLIEDEMADSANDSRFWDRGARKYEASPIADMEGYERSLERTRAYLSPTHSVFEFGCGTGSTALKLAPFASHILATDISPEMIVIAREKAAAENCANVAFEVATPETGNWPGASFDAVLGFNILHLVRARDVVIASVHRLLKPGGVFISKTPCIGEMNVFIRMAIPLMQAIGAAPHVDVFSAEALEQEIVGAGFEIVERGRHGSRGKDARIFLAARKR
jgi:ubiquinone/menaquinone biosynthesis C-methylase UbiE